MFLLTEKLGEVYNFAYSQSLDAIYLFGDFNSRSTYLGDSTSNFLGNMLTDFISSSMFNALVPSSQTFKCTNGGSIIDFMIYTNIKNYTTSFAPPIVDVDVELFSG